MTNFDFLKKIDGNLYEIITEAEKLYTSEFFEQCMGQTRRFGEQMCKSIMADRRLMDGSFDDMIATLKDRATTMPEKEFVEDLYFLKKQGNLSVHSSVVKKDGVVALECLQRAFEAAINYVVFYKKGSKSILKKQYDVELLVTGKASLREKYEAEKENEKSAKKNVGSEKRANNTAKKSTAKKVQQSYAMKPKPQKNKKGVTPFWIFVGISAMISVVLMLAIFLVLI